MLHRHFVTRLITVCPDGVVCSAINFFLIIFSKYKPTGYMRKPKITTNMSRKLTYLQYLQPVFETLMTTIMLATFEVYLLPTLPSILKFTLQLC